MARTNRQVRRFRTVRPVETDIRLPVNEVAPLVQVLQRLAIALAILVAVAFLVYLERDGYSDASDDEVSLLDSFYYATVTLSTTGYGDIAPTQPGTRFVNIVLITPLRVAFLIVLIGTTIEVLAARSREYWQISQWRKRLDKHTVVIGYGTKGRSALQTLVSGGVAPNQIVVVDPSQASIAEANAVGMVGIVGDATRADVLRRAEVQRAERVLVTANRDDTAVLVTLTVRQLNPDAMVVVSVREGENVALLRQSGADAVVTSSDAVGRIMGLSTVSPALGSVLEDLLSYGEGLEVAERKLLAREEGRSPRQLDDVVVAVVRDGTVYRYFDPAVSQLVRGDRLVVVRSAEELPWAPRPGADTDSADGDADDDADDSAGDADDSATEETEAGR